MTSGKAIALLLLLLPTPSLAGPSAAEESADALPGGVVTLISGLRHEAPATTPYTEVRFVEMLDAPLQLRGELDYGRDGSLTKRVTAPYRETTTIAAGQVTLERQGKPARRFALKRAPALAGFLESFTATLSGDAPRLSKNYVIALEGDDTHWRLVLTPKDKALAKHVRQVRIDGLGTTPRCFHVDETGGDTSVLLVDSLAGAKLADPPTSAQLETLCRTAP